jgi:hypothetical protein
VSLSSWNRAVGMAALAYQGGVRATISATITRPESAGRRPGIRFGLIDQALAPLNDTLGATDPERLTQLKHDLAAVVSAEALFSLTDLCGLAPRRRDRQSGPDRDDRHRGSHGRQATADRQPPARSWRSAQRVTVHKPGPVGSPRCPPRPPRTGRACPAPRLWLASQLPVPYSQPRR